MVNNGNDQHGSQVDETDLLSAVFFHSSGHYSAYNISASLTSSVSECSAASAHSSYDFFYLSLSYLSRHLAFFFLIENE